MSRFLRGSSTYSLGEVLERLDRVVGQFLNPGEVPYTLTTPYKSLKSGHVALTSYAAQKVHQQLLIEQRATVDPDGGLHVFAPQRKNGPINLRLSWDTYGATTFKDIQTVLLKHQPLTFNYLQHLATAERRDSEKEYRYRPPDFVREALLRHIQSLTPGRWLLRYFFNSITHEIEMRRGYKFSMESYSWPTGQRKRFSTMRADCAWPQATTIRSTSPGS